MTHVLVVGAGAIAQRVHLPFLAAHPQVSHLSIADRDRPEAAARLAQEYGATVHTAEIESSDADRVWICTPPVSHAELAIRALTSGKDVVVEKPLALHATDAVAVAEAAARHGRTVHVCHTPRHRPDTARLTSLVNEGGLGRLHRIDASWTRRNGVPATQGGLSVGVLWDLGSHLIDLAAGLVGPSASGVAVGFTHRPVAVESASADWYQGSGRAVSGPVLAAFAGMIVLDDGPVINVTAAWDAPVARDTVVVDVAGSLAHARLRTVFGFSPDRATLRGSPLEMSDVETGERHMLYDEQLIEPTEYRTQLEQVFAAQSDWRTGLARSVTTVALCEALADSVRSVAPVAVKTMGTGVVGE